MADHALATVLGEARDYARQAKSASTIRAYRADWRHFEGWCLDRSREARPASAETVALYMTELARTHRVSTLTRRLTALSEAHQLAGWEITGRLSCHTNTDVRDPPRERNGSAAEKTGAGSGSR